MSSVTLGVIDVNTLCKASVSRVSIWGGAVRFPDGLYIPVCSIGSMCIRRHRCVCVEVCTILLLLDLVVQVYCFVIAS